MDYLKQRKRTAKLIAKLLRHPAMSADIEQDMQFIFANDPAAKSLDEVATYTTAFAIAAHRVAHAQPDPRVARQIAEYAKSITGVDIHPRATIGVPFAIDHGVGVVIGETAVIGKNCMLYHGVTLGAKHLKERDQAGQDRHPKLGDNVIIYSNTTILGNVQIPSNMLIPANRFLKSQDEIDALIALKK